MYSNLCQVSEQGFRENRHRGSRTLLTAVIEIKRTCMMRRYDIYKVKNAWVESVCRHGIHHFQYSC
jgi:hypothetical protein